jgi:predicted glycosyltransferase
MTGPSVLFYVQHLLGIGHLTRASRIARALIDSGMQVTLVTGGMPVPGFPGPDIPHISLPPVAAQEGAFKGLVDENGQSVDAAFLDARAGLLLKAYRRLKPDIVMIEAFPFGRRQMRFELLPLIDAIEATQPKPLLVASLRDILQKRTRLDRDQETVDLVRQRFDLVLVHGDPTFAALGDSFALADQISDKVAYTGLVSPPPPPAPVERFEIVVSAGGGAVGKDLVLAALGAATALPELDRWCITTGPNLPQADFDRLTALAPANVQLVRFRSDLASLMLGAQLSVSQAGYNTVAEILQAGCRALLVPYAAQGETEQADRAALLERAGRVSVLPEADLSSANLTCAIRQTLAQPVFAASVRIEVDGAAQSAQILHDIVTDLRKRAL